MCKLKCMIDWLAFTYKPDINLFEDRFGKGSAAGLTDIDMFFIEFPEFDALKSEFLILNTFSHYEKVIGFLGVSDTCRISFNTPDYTSVAMGVNVSVPSHGLEWLFELFGLKKDDDDAVQQLFSILKYRQCSCSRIDLCFDDYTKTFRPSNYIAWWFSGSIRSHFRKIQTASSGREVGNTFYLGSRSTGRYLRIYDKDVESNGEIDAVRYEFELHVKYAKDMFEYLIEHSCIEFDSYLRTFLEVIDPTTCPSNKSYCSLLPEWEEWLRNHKFNEELGNKTEIPQYTLNQRKTDATYWLLNNCLRTIKGYVSVFGWESLQGHVEKEKRPIPDKYRVLLDLAMKSEWDPCEDENF